MISKNSNKHKFNTGNTQDYKQVITGTQVKPTIELKLDNPTTKKNNNIVIV